MADSLTCNLRASIDAVFSNAIATDLTSTATVTPALSIALAFTDGTSASKCDKIWYDFNRALSGATSEDLDLYDLASFNIGAGAGKDPLGGTWATVEVVGMLIRNATTSTGNLTIGGKAATTAWNSVFNADDDAAFGPLPPGGFLCFGAYSDPAFAVADTTNHLLKIASSATLTYDIIVLARSA